MQNPFRCFNSSPEVIRLAVMRYIRYPLSLRQVEDLLFERGIDIRHETPGLQGCAEVSQARDEALRSPAIDRHGSSPVVSSGDECDRECGRPDLRSLAQQSG